MRQPLIKTYRQQSGGSSGQKTATAEIVVSTGGNGREDAPNAATSMTTPANRALLCMGSPFLKGKTIPSLLVVKEAANCAPKRPRQG
jgi:hypothetical protein